MKITSLKTYVVAVPPPHVGGMYWIFVQLETACGISGVGEIYATSFNPSAMVPLIDDVFQRYLVDHDPHQIERFWRAAYSAALPSAPIRR
jgi:galactonate dehydratase